MSEISKCPIGVTGEDLLWTMVRAAGLTVSPSPIGVSEADLLWALLNGNRGVRTSQTGDVVATLAAARFGWIVADGKTIGDAASGANGRANADSEALFKLLWEIDQFAVMGGKGANAAADWAAHKKIALPDMRGRTLVGVDESNENLSDNAFGTAVTLGSIGGRNGVKLTGSHIPRIDLGLDSVAYSSVGSNPVASPGGLIYSDANIAITAQQAGIEIGTEAEFLEEVSTVPPSMAVSWLIKL